MLILVILYSRSTGACPIRFTIKYKRLAYLHHLLTRSEGELIYKVYEAQRRRPVKNDWTTVVSNDLKEILNLTEESIKNMKKDKFKTLLKQKVSEAAFHYLENIKKTHSKAKNISYNNLEMQPYMKCSNFTTNEKLLLFKLRTAMVDVKMSFKSM